MSLQDDIDLTLLGALEGEKADEWHEAFDRIVRLAKRAEAVQLHQVHVYRGMADVEFSDGHVVREVEVCHHTGPMDGVR